MRKEIWEKVCQRMTEHGEQACRLNKYKNKYNIYIYWPVNKEGNKSVPMNIDHNHATLPLNITYTLILKPHSVSWKQFKAVKGHPNWLWSTWVQSCFIFNKLISLFIIYALVSIFAWLLSLNIKVDRWRPTPSES